MKEEEIILDEIKELPKEQWEEVLDFIRYLKIKVKSRDELKRDFLQALCEMRKIAKRKGISERDIQREIGKVRGLK